MESATDRIERLKAVLDRNMREQDHVRSGRARELAGIIDAYLEESDPENGKPRYEVKSVEFYEIKTFKAGRRSPDQTDLVRFDCFLA